MFLIITCTLDSTRLSWIESNDTFWIARGLVKENIFGGSMNFQVLIAADLWQCFPIGPCVVGEAIFRIISNAINKNY
jgi:hypothetical protein